MESSISSSDSSPRNLHFVIIPWLAPGHMIPMLDIACLLARRGATISLITTPANLSRVHNAAELPVRFVPLPFPSVEFGLPPGCENLDSLPSRSLAPNFYNASKTLKEPLIHHLLAPNTPPPACILGDSAHVWAADVARQLRVQTLVFRGYGCFATLCIKNIMLHRTHETVSANTDLFVIPGLPQRIEITRAQLPRELQSSVQHPEIIKEVSESDARADGIVINSFDELEAGYGELLEKATAKKVFMIGPASSHQRSNGGNEAECKAWLDSMRPRSVIYVCFGSMSPFGPRQLTELGHGLLASGRPFIWVIKSVPNAEFEHWLQENFCDESRCLIIRRWAPQAMILLHGAVGGFVTHCGWNSTMEGVCAGLPLVTWPLFSEQFLNERLVVDMLRVGVPVGVVRWTEWVGAEDEAAVRRESIASAVAELMAEGEATEGRRTRAREFAEKAKEAVMEEGSSYLNLTMLIHYVLNHQEE